MDSYLLGQYRKRMDNGDDDPSVCVFASKKYKPVALKVKPVYAELPEQFRIKQEIRGDPLKAMLCLNLRPPDFVPTGRYT